MANEAPDNGSGVGVVEGDKPADTEENPVREMTLAQRMAAIRGEAYGIGKDNIKMKSRTGVDFTIKGHTVEAVLAEMRPLFSAYRVHLVPSIVERTYSGNRCDILVDFEFESLDDAQDRRTVRWAGSGCDESDKGLSKAGTNALKEMLKKLFLITDRDDAKEEEERIEHRPEGATRQEVDSAKESARAALEQWAKSTKLAIENAPDLKALARVQRDNKDQLTHPELPDVTRTFFVELIERRKAELEAKGA